MTRDEMIRGRYLGDGVYVKSHGYGAVTALTVNTHEGLPAVVLEENVLFNLIQYTLELAESEQGLNDGGNMRQRLRSIIG